jgi:hypothetical protein
MSSDEQTKAYVARRIAEGKSKREIIRCLNRHIAREMFKLLTAPPAVPHGTDLRELRTQARITIADAAEHSAPGRSPFPASSATSPTTPNSPPSNSDCKPEPK